MACLDSYERQGRSNRLHLSKHDLSQMNDEWLNKRQERQLLEVSKRLLHDVKELHDRLNQNPSNSSRPPTSQAPWEKSGESEEKRDAVTKTGTADATGEPLNESPQDTEESGQAATGKQDEPFAP